MSKKDSKNNSTHKVARLLKELLKECKNTLPYARAGLQKYAEGGKFGVKEYFAILSIFLGLFGLWYNGKEQISIYKATAISDRQQKLSKAISKAVATVINQSNLCPISDEHQLKLMKNKRVNSTVNIRAYGSGITLEIDRNLRPLIAKINLDIYDINNRDICKLNIKKFDYSTNKVIEKINKIFEFNYANESKYTLL